MNLGIPRQLWGEFCVSAKSVIQDAYRHVDGFDESKVNDNLHFQDIMSLAVSFAKIYKAGEKKSIDPVNKGRMPDKEEMQIFLEACDIEVEGGVEKLEVEIVNGETILNPKLKA